MKRTGPARIAIIVMIVITISCGQSFARRSTYGESSQCKANLRNISTALEMYATDNQGVYPPLLSYLSPHYLTYTPTCPSLGIDTYSCGYSATAGKEFYVCCIGKNHPEFMDNMPAYSSKQGAQETADPTYKGAEDEKRMDTATSLILLGVLSVVSYLVYRKK
jgi:hypothetical protein